MSIETEIQTLETKINQSADLRSRAQGAFDQSMSRLKSEHNCDTLETAQVTQGQYEEEAKGHEATAQSHLDECRKLVEVRDV